MTGRILLLTLLFSCFLFAAADEPKELPKNTPFSDENTGIVFPPELGNFHKTEIRISSNPVVGTQIRYDGNLVGCCASLYIYALSENPSLITPEEFLNHYEKARETVLKLEALSGRVKEIESVSRKVFSDKNSPAYRETFHLTIDGQEIYRSELLMILCGDRIVKLRVTVPDAQKEAKQDCRGFIRELCRLFYRNQPVTFQDIQSEKKPPKR